MTEVHPEMKVILFGATDRLWPSFRGAGLAQPNQRTRNPEVAARDSPMCNSTSEVRAARAPE
jgi:hypothetical protein